MYVIHFPWRARHIAIVSFAVAALLPAASGAATCQQAKLTAAGKKTAGKLKCHAKAVKLGTGVSSDCIDPVELKFQTAFTKADAKGGCPTTGNDGVVETAVDQCVADVLSALGAGSPPAPPAACLQAKLKASGKKAYAKLKCWAKAAATGAPVSPECLSKAEAKFGIAFTKAELKTGCAQTGDAGDVETTIDTCVTNVVGLLPPPTTTSTTVTSSTTATGSSSSTTTSTVTTSTAPVTTSSTSTTLPTCGGSEPAAVAGMTAAQNTVRANASPTPVPALDPFCWGSSVAAVAQAWADGCDYSHNPGRGFLGENIYATAYTGSPPPGYNPPIDAVDAWASEAADYDYNTNTCSSVCGHYTQIVWRDSQVIGCGLTYCTTNSPFGPSFPNWTLVVCDYSPPGNYIGQQPY